jgi:hypothetical protein
VGMTGLSERKGMKGLETLDLPAILNKPFPNSQLLEVMDRAFARAK